MLGHPSSDYGPIVFSRHFYEAGNFKDSSTYIGSLSVTFFCVLQNVYEIFFHEAGTPKNYLTFLRQLQQLSFYGSHMSSSHSLTSISPGKSNFLPKWLTNTTKSFFGAYHPLEVIGNARNRCVSLS